VSTMEKDEKQKREKGISLPRTSTADLIGRQSVRATFKLTEGCIDAISIVATQLGIKQKSLFDHLAEDAGLLRSIAREIQHIELTKQNRIQKTFVISKKSLVSLDNVSKDFNAPRNALIEYSVRRLLPIIAKERKKHYKRKEILGEIASHFKEGENLLQKIGKQLGFEDPIYHRLESVMNIYETAYNNIVSFIEKTKIIEDFQPDI
jgi:uncharacterized protein (UPF0147 family)